MIWVAYLMLALESLVMVFSLRLMWLIISEASREPADPFSAGEDPPERPSAQPLQRSTEEKDEGSSLREYESFPAWFTLEEVDQRGYVSSRKLQMGCEAAVCRTPFGAKIVAGRRSLKEPQYAWDYASVGLAEKALARAEFDTHPIEGIIGVEDRGRGCLRAAEPKDYFRRWRYTAGGQMERF
jgi:hypothetical protein